MEAAESGADLSTRDLCALVNQLARQIQDHVQSCAAGLGLTAPQAMALHELGTPLSMRQLADRMFCEPSNITYVIDRMEEAGLVERRPHPNDRRARRLVLTPHGQDLRARLGEVMSEESPLGDLTATDQRQLRTLLARAVADPARARA